MHIRHPDVIKLYLFEEGSSEISDPADVQQRSNYLWIRWTHGAVSSILGAHGPENPLINRASPEHLSPPNFAHIHIEMAGTQIRIFWATLGPNGWLSRPSNATIVSTVRSALSNRGSWSCPGGIPPIWVIACGPREDHPHYTIRLFYPYSPFAAFTIHQRQSRHEFFASGSQSLTFAAYNPHLVSIVVIIFYPRCAYEVKLTKSVNPKIQLLMDPSIQTSPEHLSPPNFAHIHFEMAGTQIRIFWAMLGPNGWLSRPSDAAVVRTVRAALSNRGSWNCPGGIPPIWVIACGPRGNHPHYTIRLFYPHSPLAAFTIHQQQSQHQFFASGSQSLTFAAYNPLFIAQIDL
ncbi:hypothetical protein DFJ43DRAFT_1043379 [Lentinula guzmanii]|uniref:Uncharacterized protein n=1 Tax=Lentinula guzmanii TaxID=2804957 RepID=A0AA38MWA8_9AGAR|nr:hypothetical protein DFJ43DRAFT_1043379 [Lentinula guzmanii]